VRSNIHDLLVIGGGIVGASAAYHSARLGRDTVLVDGAHTGQATAAGAGIIAPGTSRRTGAELDLARDAAQFYPELISHLAEDTGVERAAEEVGALLVARSDEEAERLTSVGEHAAELREGGMPFIGDISLLDEREAREYFPALGPITAALHQSRAMRVNGRVVRDALIRGAERRGARVVRGHAQLLRDHPDAVTVEVDGEVIRASAAILATGAWTGRLSAELGVRLPVVPQRGQIVHLEMPDAVTTSWPIVVGFHSHYILTFPERRVVIGATRETGSGFDPRVTAAGVREVLEQGLSLAPGLAGGTIGKIRVGLRPATPDGLPVLGRLPGHDSLYVATGHGPSGLHLGPYSGAAVAEIALGIDGGEQLAPFSPARFVASG